MARFISKNDRLYKKYVLYRRLFFIFGITGFISAVSAALFGFAIILLPLSIPSFVLLPLLVWLCYHYYNKAEIIKSGIDGEIECAKVLAELPDEYSVFCNTSISFRNRRSEIDFIVTGPTGVYVIEAKNINGVLSGNYSDNEWTQIKTLKNGNSVTKVIYSPVKQVRAQALALIGSLYEHGLKIPAVTAVYFANRKTELDLWNEKRDTPLFLKNRNGDRDIINMIVSGKASLSKNDLSLVNKILGKI